MRLYDSAIGALVVGISLNTYLYGLVTYQFAAYYRTKPNDPPATRYMVLFLFVLDTFHSVSVTYMIWSYTVTDYDDLAALALLKAVEWPQIFTPLATALAALVTQIYLGFQIWLFTSSKILFRAVILLVIPSFILGMACTIEASIIKFLSETLHVTPLLIAWLSMQVVAGTFITITLTIFLSRSRTGHPGTNTVLNRLIRRAINAGLFPGIFAMADLIAFAIRPNMKLHAMFAIPIGRIYTNTLLNSLLIRKSLRAEMDEPHDMNEATNSIRWAHTDSSGAPPTDQLASVVPPAV